jgi:hypothetical protein
MPIVLTETTTPAGKRVLRSHASGEVTLEEAKTFGVRLQPGAPNHQGLLLVVIEKGTDYTPEARKYFPTLNGTYKAMAFVITSPIVRAAVNMMVRLIGQSPNMRMFTREDEALAWLDTRPD